MSDSFCTPSVSGIRCASSTSYPWGSIFQRWGWAVALKIAHADAGSSSTGVDRYLLVEKFLDDLDSIDIVSGSLLFIWAESTSHDNLAFNFACRTAVLAVSFSNIG